MGINALALSRLETGKGSTLEWRRGTGGRRGRDGNCTCRCRPDERQHCSVCRVLKNTFGATPIVVESLDQCRVGFVLRGNRIAPLRECIDYLVGCRRACSGVMPIEVCQ